jgi:AraC-like DNA-binding protein
MENINFLASAGSLVTSLDLKNLGDDAAASQLECTFWTRMDGQVCVHYFRPETDVVYQPHLHSEYTVMVCLAGGLKKTEAGETHLVGPGGAVITNAGVEHATGYLRQQAPACEVVCVTFDPKVLAALSADFPLSGANGEMCPVFTGGLENKVVHDCAVAMAEELRRREAGHKVIVETLAVRLLVEAFRAWPRDQINLRAADSVPRLPQRDFVRAYEYMRRCRKGTFRLEHLSRFLGISKERFTRLFLASTHHTPANFYNRMLLERGRELLRDPKLSIKEISFQLGFKTVSHFIVAFRREFSAAPQEYRQRDLMAEANSGSKNHAVGQWMDWLPHAKNLPAMPALAARRVSLACPA